MKVILESQVPHVLFYQFGFAEFLNKLVVVNKLLEFLYEDNFKKLHIPECMSRDENDSISSMVQLTNLELIKVGDPSISDFLFSALVPRLE